MKIKAPSGGRNYYFPGSLSTGFPPPWYITLFSGRGPGVLSNLPSWEFNSVYGKFEIRIQYGPRGENVVLDLDELMYFRALLDAELL